MISPARRSTSVRRILAPVLAASATVVLAVGIGASVASAETVPAPGSSASPTASPTVSSTASPAPDDDQTAAGEVTGTVTGAETGNPLPGATVSAVPNDSSETTRRVTTMANGDYRIVGVAPGGYKIVFEMEGFEPVTRAVAMQPYGIQTVDAELSPLSVEVTVDRTSLAAGESVQLDATGFRAGERVDVEVHSAPVRVASFTTDADGSLSTRITVPTSVEPGVHEIVVIGESGRTGSVTVTITGSAPLIATG